MEIRNNAEALKAFLGVSSSVSAKSLTTQGSQAEGLTTAFTGDVATLSEVGTAVQGALVHEGVRLDKVVAVQNALAGGTYRVPATDVADKLIDAMLVAGSEPGR